MFKSIAKVGLTTILMAFVIHGESYLMWSRVACGYSWNVAARR